MSSNHHTPHSVNFGLTAVNFNVPLGELDQAITDAADGTTLQTLVRSNRFRIAGSAKTILTGAITLASGDGGLVSIETQAAAAIDDLDTINGGTAGDIIVIYPVNTARSVVVKHGSGNIRLSALRDYVLDDNDKHLMLQFINSFWRDVSVERTKFSVVELNLGADITMTGNVVFVDVDAALSITIDHGETVRLGFQGNMSIDQATRFWQMNFARDGTPVAADDGIAAFRNQDNAGAGRVQFNRFEWIETGLTPGSTTFTVRWKLENAGDTVTLYAGAGTAELDTHPQFTVEAL